MTDEERQKLIAALRRKADTGAVRVPMCGEAADEIERLAALAQSDAEPVGATSRSLLRPANQKPTICYCKPGECSAPKPEWCIGRRYADGFREANAEHVAAAQDWRSTPAMRTRIRELARPNSDDYDRAVIAVLDDFDAALAQSDAEPVVQTEFELEDGLHELAFPAPPRYDISAGLIEAAELAEKQASEWAGSRSAESCNTLRLFAKELRLRRSRAADRSGK